MSYTWAVVAGSLPPGLSLSPAGTFSGAPITPGTYAFTVQVTDSLGATATAALSITVPGGTVAITTTALAAASLGLPYHGILTASGGTPPYAWSTASAYSSTYAATYGTFSVPGMTLNPDGTLTGTPSAAGTYTITAVVTDAFGATASASLTLIVFVAVPVLPSAGPWRILYGPAQPAGGVTGEILQAQNKTITLRTEPDQNHEVSFDADGSSDAVAGITELETDLLVMYGTQYLFSGRVVPTQDTLTASAHRTLITALDYREVLRRRAVLPGDQLSWTGADQAVIAWNLIQATQARPGGNLGIARGTGQATGIPRTWNATAGDYIGDDITALAQLDNGFEWQITPYGPADLRLDVFYPQQGNMGGSVSNQPASNAPGGPGDGSPAISGNSGVVLQWGDSRVSSITRNVDPSTFADSVYVTGDTTFALTPQALEAADIATRPEGRWDSVIGTADNIQFILNEHAVFLLTQAQVLTPSYTITFYPGTWGGPSDIWLGDTITLQIDSGRLEVSAALRVVEMAFAISADNTETLTLTLGAIPFRFHKVIPKIIRHLKGIHGGGGP